MSDRFTVVFKGDIRAFDGNPLHIVSQFGEVAACGEGDAFEAADTIETLRAENARLKDEIEHWAATHQIIVNEIARLREALKPILPDKVLDEEEYSLVCNFHLNAALMAYGEIHD